MKIKLGPAGIPQKCKGSSADGVAYVKKEGLQAMEVQFVRGVHMKNSTALKVGEAAKINKIELSVHAPYYINLASHDKKIKKESKQRILDSLERAHYMGAKIVVVHAGYYGKHSKEKCLEIMKRECKNITNYISKKRWKVKLGLETTGKKKQWGTLDEILSVSSKVKRCVPIIDFAHLFAKENGAIDYKKILNKVKRYKHLHTHFSNMKKNKKGTYSDIHMPIDHAPPFRPLAKEILKKKLDITIISESPRTDLDSLKMKRIFKRLGYSRFD
jgi:deoxyribonuclease-4